ncbi:MAG TPA: hypothetical protein VMT16_09390 [Thermoanaerobaculia bacterium]|nr:hypothetical protein [Thermoanaerobaculia bacterium]
MTARPVNLARRPFANTRPIVRVTLLLWVVGGLLATFNGVLYWRSLFGLEARKGQLVTVRREVAEERQRIAAAEAALAEMSLRSQNARAEFLNQRIAERTFPWSRLFDQLADVLPLRVRLFRLTPESFERQRSTRGDRMRQRVRLQMTGVAENDEALLELLDSMFAHPAFEDPFLPREVRQPNRSLEFQLGVYYLPDAAVVEDEEESVTTGEEPPPAEDAAPPAADGAATRRRAAAPDPGDAVPPRAAGDDPGARR